MTSGESIVLGHIFQDAGGSKTCDLRVEVSPLDLIQEWKRCATMADFTARYVAHNHPDNPHAGNLVSSVINELIENAAKFTHGSDEYKILITVRDYPDSLVISVTNVIARDVYNSFIGLARKLTDCSDVQGLYLSTLEYHAENEPSGSGVGILSLMNNFSARIGYRFEALDAHDLVKATVSATIDHKDIQ